MRKRGGKPKTVAALNLLASQGALRKSFKLDEKPPNPIGKLRRKTRRSLLDLQLRSLPSGLGSLDSDSKPDLFVLLDPHDLPDLHDLHGLHDLHNHHGVRDLHDLISSYL